MKILLINNRFPNEKKPYVATFIKSIYNILKETGNQVDLLISRRNRLDRFFKTIDSFLFYIQLLFFNNYSIYDIIYINRFNYFGFLLSPRIKNNQHVIIHWHGSELRRIKLLNRFSFLFLKSTYLHIVPSLYFKNLLASTLMISDKQIIISPSGGVDLNIFRDKFKNNEEDSDKIVLGFASGAKKEKGFHLITQLIRDLNDIQEITSKRIQCNIIDYGEMRNELIKFKSESNIRIIEPLNKSSMPDFYNNCDILLFPTYHESLGLVALEALACNIPVIGTNCTALPEYIISGKTGELFIKGDYKSFKASIIKVINNATDYLPNQNIDSYSKDKVVKTYNHIINSLKEK